MPRAVIQKIMIARLIITSPKLLLMEDPLHFIPETEKKAIVEYIMSPERPWTALVVSDYHYWEEHSSKTITLNG